MPDWSREIRERLAGLRVDPARVASVVEEIGQHLDDRYAELIGRGAPAEEARAAVLGELTSPAFAAALGDALPKPPFSSAPPADRVRST